MINFANGKPRPWAEMTRKERKLVLVIGSAQVICISAALLDLRRRPVAKMRGSKRLWTPIVFVNFIGPLAYYLFGIRRK
jgi:hypothetical protein